MRQPANVPVRLLPASNPHPRRLMSAKSCVERAAIFRYLPENIAKQA